MAIATWEIDDEFGRSGRRPGLFRSLWRLVLHVLSDDSEFEFSRYRDMGTLTKGHRR